MAARKDSRGYALRTGEYERSDGRYSFSFTDATGKRHTLYAKSLAGLRAREKELNLAYDQGLDPVKAAKLTLNDIVDRYMSQKFNLKPTTRGNYMYMYDRFVRDSFGKRKIKEIRYSDCKKFYYSVLEQQQMKAYTLDNINTVLHPAFQMAIRDGLITTNPTDGVMNEIKRSNLWDKPKRRALTIPEQKAFMDFLKNNREYEGWLPIITILLGTGMRIGECLGLRWEDLDFEKRLISVNHNLTDRPDDKGVCKKRIQTPKTEAGTRTIPMIEEVYQAFLTEYEIQRCLGFCEEEIDGYSGFVFSTAAHTVYIPSAINNAIRRAITAYNAQESAAARKEKREPLLLPKFSCHHLRHTFCTRFCENETNIKVIQSVMGHADIQTTMDIYADCTDDKKQEVMANLEGKIIL
ncbi:MAG: site-specific integrase [Bacteroidaceae bacterium]|nr:site-specific integrase [Bacteroidaceae bacterium]